MAKVRGFEPRSQGFGDLHVTVTTHRHENGRECRIRTYDPLVPNQVRYQTALIPEIVITLVAHLHLEVLLLLLMHLL
jgi:hypothetical protein